jgi:PKD repeat protein
MATNEVGCQSVYTMNQPIQVNPVPVASFSSSVSSLCQPGTPIQFTNQSTGANTYLWNFGDGTTSSQTNPAKIYTDAGNYSVSLVVGNGFGCYDTVIQPNLITVNAAINPVITSNASSGCMPLVVNFSTAPIAGASGIQWNFGNGQQSQAASFNATYANAGQYNASLQVTMANGCVYTVAQPSVITGHPKPVAAFSISNATGCAPLTVGLDNTSTGATSYTWSFSEGPISTEFEPTQTFTIHGLHGVRLIATNQFGCTNLLLLSNSVNVSGPVASFTASDTAGCPPLNVQFSNTSADATSYFWNFGNGATSTQASPTVSIAQLGSYDVMLVAINGAGCRDTLLVEEMLDVQYEVVPYTAPAAVNACAPFNASFSNDNSSAQSYLWNFGDGTTSTDASPNHVYTEAGQYTVSLTVNNGGACMQSYPVYQQINIEGVVPIFTTTYEACPPFPVTFHVDTTNIESYLWDFGDGNGGIGETISHTYSTPGTYTLELFVSNFCFRVRVTNLIIPSPGINSGPTR